MNTEFIQDFKEELLEQVFYYCNNIRKDTPKEMELDISIGIRNDRLVVSLGANYRGEGMYKTLYFNTIEEIEESMERLYNPLGIFRANKEAIDRKLDNPENGPAF